MRMEKISIDWFTLFSVQCKIIFYGFMQGIHATQFTVLRPHCGNWIIGQLNIVTLVER